MQIRVRSKLWQQECLGLQHRFRRSPDSRPGFTLWSEGKSHFSGYHPIDAFTVAPRNGKCGTLVKPGGALCLAADSENIIRSREPLSIYWPETVEAELAR